MRRSRCNRGSGGPGGPCVASRSTRAIYRHECINVRQIARQHLLLGVDRRWTRLRGCSGGRITANDAAAIVRAACDGIGL